MDSKQFSNSIHVKELEYTVKELEYTNNFKCQYNINIKNRR